MGFPRLSVAPAIAIACPQRRTNVCIGDGPGAERKRCFFGGRRCDPVEPVGAWLREPHLHSAVVACQDNVWKERWMDGWMGKGMGRVGGTRLAQGAWASHAWLTADGCTGCTVAIQVQECVGMYPRRGAPRGRCTGETNRNRRQGGQQRSTRGVSEGRGVHALGCHRKGAVSIVEPERGRCCGCC